MKKEITLSLLLLGGVSFTAGAQSPQQSFQEFRRQILDDYQTFRQTILDHYADFLDGTWHEYEPLRPLERDRTPKPMKVPDVKVTKPVTTPVKLPAPRLASLPESRRPATDPEPDKKSPFGIPQTVTPPEAGNEIPASLKVRPDLGAPILAALPKIPRSGDMKLPVDATRPDGVGIAEIDLKPIPVEEEPGGESREGKEPVMFYGMEFLVPQVDFKIMRSMATVGDFSRNWKLLDEQEVADMALAALEPKMKELGLNDYLAYEFLCAYMDSKFPEASAASKMSGVHYLLSHMGYNARIAMTTKTGDAVLLIPVDQTLYGKVYMEIGGQRYYVMSSPGVSVIGQSVATCDLPKLADSGKKFDMRINGLNLPVKAHDFEVSHGKLRLKGSVNENLMPVVYRYPQMETADYAVSELDGNLRRSLVSQLREQLSGMDPVAATNELLQFVQSGFEYATDDDFHGFEKPYFLEENLFYPKNDCEDRAIFYTYMLWNALGLESQLLFFPGHESASVSLPGAQIKGTSYEHGGRTYYISDPTYIGSRTGMCMPSYVNTAPTIDLSIPD